MKITNKEIDEKTIDELAALSPWSHYFMLDEFTYTGFYPNIKNRTHCSKKDPSELINKFKTEYASQILENSRFLMPMDYLKKVLGTEFYESSFLDIACNDGLKSLYLKSLGAGEVRGIEIREDCIKRANFMKTLSGYDVDFQHYAISADDAEFGENFESTDVVCSFGLLYHLVDHYQHIRNLKNLTKKVMIMFSSYHSASGGLAYEDKTHPYKSFFGIRKIPTKNEIYEMIYSVGFNEVFEIQYNPIMGEQNFMDSSVYIIAFS